MFYGAKQACTIEACTAAGVTMTPRGPHAQYQHHSSGQVSAVCTAVYLVPTPPSVKCELSTDQAAAAKVHSPPHWALY